MSYHKSVLLNEVVTYLQPRSCGIYLDCTAGGGGHSEGILRASSPDGQVIGLDWDEEALAESQRRLAEYGSRVQLVGSNFSEMDVILKTLGCAAVDGIVMDLGVSSRQLDEPSRGFSLQRDGLLDMRMSRQLQIKAQDILYTASQSELTKIFRDYGEERKARSVAREIVRERTLGKIDTTTQLAKIVRRVLGPKKGQIDPSTRVFQALRIAVNDELGNLSKGLSAAVDCMKSGARLAVISFHSLEDRIVKTFFRDKSSSCECPSDFPKCVCHRKQILRIITRRPITPSITEMESNPRARSAKLRVAEKV